MKSAYALWGYFLGRLLPFADYLHLGFFIFWSTYIFICEYPSIKKSFIKENKK